MKKKLLTAAAIVGILLLLSCTGKNNEVLVEDVMIANGQGTFTKAQITIPADYNRKKLPGVVLCHGFRGNMNSAGMEALAHRLSEEGIAAIRMDFAHNLSDDPKSSRISRYTVESMVCDQVLCAEYLVNHYNVDGERLGVFGRSLGGRSAMAQVNEQRGGFDYKALVLVAPAGNEDAIQRYMGGENKWNQMKKEAERRGSVTHQKVILTPEFFSEIESYTPVDTAGKYDHPVLVIYNTEDYVVLPSAAVECAQSYKKHEILEITSKKSPHGLEMGMEDSAIKDKILLKIVEFYRENLH